MLIGVLVAALAMVTAYIVIAEPFEVQQETMWPLDVGGRPAGLGEPGDLAEAVTPEAPVGAYVWNDFDGWHLWFVLDSTIPKVSGTIVSTDDIEKSVLTPAAAGSAEADGKTLAFTIESEAGLAGIDFEPGFYADRFEVRIETPDGPLPPELVHRGRSAAVAALPLVVEKVPKSGD